MSSRYENQFPMERVSFNVIPLSWLLLCMVEFFLLHVLLNHVGGAHKFLSRTESFFKSQLGFLFADSVTQLEKSLYLKFPNQVAKTEYEQLCREDVEMVMARLGIFCHPEEEKLQERLGSDDLTNLFEEKKPSLEEVKEAFDVFDENKDGFIDAEELQRVICLLGFKEGLEMKNCRRLIRVFDRNGDGWIDFGEFVKIMENTIC